MPYPSRADCRFVHADILNLKLLNTTLADVRGIIRITDFFSSIFSCRLAESILSRDHLSEIIMHPLQLCLQLILLVLSLLLTLLSRIVINMLRIAYLLLFERATNIGLAHFYLLIIMSSRVTGIIDKDLIYRNGNQTWRGNI